MRHISLVVPDDAPTLAAAVRRAGASWQTIILRRGEHLVDSRGDGDPGSSQLRLKWPVRICGESGGESGSVTVRGTIVAEASCAGGVISDMRLEDGGDCCLRLEGGSWDLQRLRLRCSHGAALLARGNTRVTMDECVLGGEGEHEIGQHVTLSAYGSVQEHGISKRACYAIVAREEATVTARACVLRQCSEAALLVAQRSRALLSRCRLSDCPAALVAGSGRGRALELSACIVERSVRRLWLDDDRPRAFVWSEGSLCEVRDATSGEDDAYEADHPDEGHLDGGGGRRGGGVDISRTPRGAQEGDSSDSDDSLEEQEFAGMEALIEELENAALSGATSTAAAAGGTAGR